jgi:hypothetical protein
MPRLQSRREFFRLPYPVTTGATLAVDGTNYQVEEVSEGGLRLVSAKGRFDVTAKVQGTLTLTMGLRCPVQGTVLREDGETLVLKLERGPSCYDLMREQRHVAKTYPDWKPQPA